MYEKYVEALRLMDVCIATKEAVKPEGEDWPERALQVPQGWTGPTTAKMHPCHQAWDDCFNFIFANFAWPETGQPDGGCCNWNTKHPEVEMVRPLIDGTYKSGGSEMEAIMRSIPPVLLDEIWPVGIARFLLRDHQMPLNHRWLFTFREFHNRYGNMILSS